MSQYLYFIALIAPIVFLVALLRTDIALIILIFSMMLSPELSMGGIPGRSIVVRVDDVLLFVVFLGWLAKMAVNKGMGFLRNNPLNAPIITYIGISLVATLLGAVEGYVRIQHGVFYLLKYVEYFLIFFMVVNNLRSIKQAKIFIFFMLVTCFLVAGYAWMTMSSGQRVSAPFEGDPGEPNTLAGYLLLMMGIVLGLLLYGTSLRQRLMFAGLFVFMVPPFLSTLSRGAWFGFFPMAIALVMISKKAKGILLLSIVMLAIILPHTLPQQVKDRVQVTFASGKEYTVFGRKMHFDESASSRIESWQYALTQWTRKPIIGYGVPAGIVTDCQYARVLREVGFVGFVAFVWMLAMIYRLAHYAYILNENDDFIKGLSVGFIAGFIGLLTQALTAETFIIIRIMEPFWFLTGIIVALSLFNPEKAAPELA